MRVIFAVITMLWAMSVSAQENIIERSLGDTKLLPVAKQLRTSNEKPVSMIETGRITNEAGEEARGPHDIIFSLNAGAPFAVVVNGETVNPGDSYTMSVNLTDLNHSLTLPVYPSVDGREGQVEYTLSIPGLNVDICPEGFTEDTSDCFKLEYDTLNYLCPTDFDYQDGTGTCKYVDVFDLNSSCPPSYTKTADGENCRKTLTVEYTEKCPSGMSPVGDLCVSEQTVPATSCPSGYSIDSSGRCASTSGGYPASNCPTGYSYSGGQCTKSTSRNPTGESCPSGYSSVKGGCYKRVGTANSCPSGYSYSPDSCWYNNRVSQSEPCSGSHPYGSYSGATGSYICMDKPASVYVQTQCASGTEVYGSCYDMSNGVDKEVGCSAGTYNSSTGKCEITSTKPSGNYCGYQKQSSSTCTTTSYKSLGNYCPSGMSYDSTARACVGTQSTSLQKVCPDSYSLNGSGTQCTKVETVKLGITCPDDYEKNSDSTLCIKEYSELADASCESGYTLANGECVREENKQGIANCSDGYSQINSENCRKYTYYSSTTGCPAGYEVSGSRCRKTTYVERQEDPVKPCPSGEYNYDKDQCEVNSAYVVNATCYRDEWGSSTWRSGEGNGEWGSVSPIDGEDRCTKYYWKYSAPSSEEISCERGELTVTGQRTVGGEQQCFDTGYGMYCETTEGTGVTSDKGYCTYQQPQYDYRNKTQTCPNGGTYTGGQCRVQHLEPVDYSCEEGWSLNAQNECERTLTDTPAYSCPTGANWTKNAPNCDFYNERTPDYHCPDNYDSDMPEEPTCTQIKFVDASYECPDGYSPDFTIEKCVKETRVPFL